MDFEDKGEIAHYGIADVLGVKSIDTGLLGAVAVGVIVALLHKRYRTKRMPDALAFFGGLRFVPIVSALAMSIVGLLVPLVWPTLGSWIASIGTGIAHAGVFGPFFFGMGEVLLRPIGLHHILVALFRFTDAGGAGAVCGENVSGALNLFYAQLSCHTPSDAAHTATQFLSQGKMAAYLGGLPGAALAMYHCAKRTMRPEIKALLISGVVACVVGGVTEPLEFLFLFRWAITKFDLKAPGREDEPSGPAAADPAAEDDAPKAELVAGKYDPVAILEALGGPANIQALDNCITRLRMTVGDAALLDDARLKKLGAIAVVRLDDHNVQVIIGPQVQSVKDAIAKLTPVG
ncbi:PTS transporter subunit EIIC [Streptomyces sp. H34-S4]|uniref:PTS transporter subunit EIIC n=1 Tax=Streptomyces sp. H34-S4 TaxID=2996463 RepID=UPI002D1E449D|nr:PTS transporter subunit EIIC [Streptomyces sp. H34-S4]